MSDPVNVVVHAKLEKLGSPSQQQLYSLLSEEEQQEVVEKMTNFVRQPAGHLPRQDELYLEQQLTDIFGFEVSAELDGNRLTQTMGVMAALPHLKRFPGDELKEHTEYREAGMSERRGVYGWLTDMGQLTPQAVLREKYGVALQAQFQPDWHTNYRDFATWYKFRKMLVICPSEGKAVVCSVINSGPSDWMRYQFGGTPEVIREANVWSMKARGKVMMFFVNDPQGTVQLGPRDLLRENVSKKIKISV